MAIGTWHFYNEVRGYVTKVAAEGLMNFVDAKQQGVIRFIDQNEKLAKVLWTLSRQVDADVLQKTFESIAQTDTFDVEQHPFKEEIRQGSRKIPTFTVYHAIDYVKNGTIAASSVRDRVGKPQRKDLDLSSGYSQVYLDDGTPVISFAAGDADAQVQIHADARMLTNIVNGEIGNLAGDMGAYYLAGVGKTFDFYMVNQDNTLITESRVYDNALLTSSGSSFPWRATIQQAGISCDSNGTYITNVGAVTGCREAMGRYTGPSDAPMIGASMPFYDSSWTIVVEQEESELLAPLNELAAKIGIVGALLGLIAFTAFVAVINYYVFRPLSSAMLKLHE